MKRHHWMQFVGVLFAITILTICWSISYFLTNQLYSIMNIHVHPWIEQLITSIFGLIIGFTVFFIISRMNKKMFERREQFIQSINDAMRQIATGNFNVNIEHPHTKNNPHDPFEKIVNNINYMAKQLGEMEEMRQEFISNVSHEIQSPLTSISGFARALKNEKLTKTEREHYLTIIEKESKRLSNISDNLLKLTYLEAEKHDFSLVEYRVDQQLQRIILALEPQWLAKEIQLKFTGEPTTLIADEELMNQVWFNLIHNAIKFTNIAGEINIKIKDDIEATTVIISDTGIGISEEEKLHLFERFYKADKARSSHTSGSGLGLAIVKKILSLHHALIQVDSNPSGTTFFITFNKLNQQTERT